MNSSIDIPAVNEGDLKNILDQFNLTHKIEAGDIDCICCKKRISWENIGGLVILDGELKIIGTNLRITKRRN